MDRNDQLRPRKLRHRLPDSSYQTSGSSWHVTIGTRDRETLPLASPAVAEAILETINGRVSFYNAILHLCCLMPDHAHLILQITDRGLVDVVRDLKSVTTRTWWKTGGAGKLWQESFHDHGIRRTDDFDKIVTYILNNPVRAGLVESWEQYPYICGSMIDEYPGPVSAQ